MEKIDRLDETERQLVLASLAGVSRRIVRVETPQRVLWIKRCDRPGLRAGQRLQWLLSHLAPGAPFLRPAPIHNGILSAKREMRQMAAFRAAGFATPEVCFADGSILVLSDLGRSAYDELSALRDVDPVAHDRLLIDLAGTLGGVHAAGLCHGRPHPRDFTMQETGFGFLDFEEEPAAVMPLATAQARDIWLLFFHIAARALDPETCPRALDAWRAVAPKEAADELEKIVGFFREFLPVARLAGKFHLGGDLDRFIKGTGFLASAYPAGRGKEPQSGIAGSTPAGEAG